MTAKFGVVSLEPNGSVPRFTFCTSKEHAWEHAIRVCRDLNRDCFVVQVEGTFHAKSRVHTKISKGERINWYDDK